MSKNRSDELFYQLKVENIVCVQFGIKEVWEEKNG